MTLRQDLDQVAVTAQWMAAERARESSRPDRLFDDSYAEVLAGVEGRTMLAEMAAPGDATSRTIPIRTRFFDDALLRLIDAGRIEQVVMLAAGMDTRAFRLPLPAGLTLFELDRPELLALKEARVGERAARHHRSRSRLGLGGGAAGGRPPATTDDLGRGGTARLPRRRRGAPSARDHRCPQRSAGLAAHRHRRAVTVELAPVRLVAAGLRRKGMPWRFGSDDPEGLLAAHGWTAEASQYGDDDANFGRWPWPPAPRDDAGWPRSYLVRAASGGDTVRTDRRRGMRRAAQAPRPPR
jgi:O-methyltransferase involved in polyketide biosynthesis